VLQLVTGNHFEMFNHQQHNKLQKNALNIVTYSTARGKLHRGYANARLCLRAKRTYCVWHANDFSNRRLPRLNLARRVYSFKTFYRVRPKRVSPPTRLSNAFGKTFEFFMRVCILYETTASEKKYKATGVSCLARWRRIPPIVCMM